MFSRTIKKSNIKEKLPLSPVDNSPELTALDRRPRKKLKTNDNNTHSTTNVDYKQAVDEMTSDLKYKAKPELIGITNDSAFNYNEIDTDYNRDAKAIAMKNIKISQEIKSGKLDKKFYKGMNGYAEYNEKSDNSIRSSKFTGSLGPIRAPKNIRVTCRFDYNPSLCKDWHDTGSCVFGDSCIYIHDRGDYKSGWEMEKEWEEDQKKRAKNNGHLSDTGSDNEDPSDRIDIPTTCGICSENLKNPIKTLCEHFFCEKCALSNYAKSAVCFTCNKPTNGTFNDGVQVIKKLTEMKESLKSKKTNGNNDKNKIQIIGNKDIEGLDLPELDEVEKKKLLAGVEIEKEKEDDEQDINGLAGEFKKKRAKQKSQIKYESDWLL